jgi:hypothetical protein
LTSPINQEEDSKQEFSKTPRTSETIYIKPKPKDPTIPQTPEMLKREKLKKEEERAL